MWFFFLSPDVKMETTLKTYSYLTEFIFIFIGKNYSLRLKSGTYPMKFREHKFLLSS